MKNYKIIRKIKKWNFKLSKLNRICGVNNSYTMAPKSNFLKAITLLAFIWLLVIVLMNVFNSGHSYYYAKLVQSIQQPELPPKHLPVPGLTANNKESIVLNSDNMSHLMVEYTNKEPSDEELVAIIEQKLPNFPFGYFQRNKEKGLKETDNCAVYPALEVLNYYNTYWQTYHNGNITFQLYGAYYDDRAAVDNGPVVRILAMSNHQNIEFPLSYCQLWFEDVSTPIIVPVNEYKLIWNRKWTMTPNTFVPYLLTCEMPKDVNVKGIGTPKVVNLVRQKCDTAYNSLKIVYDKTQDSVERPEFAVCVKGLDFLYQDISLRLIEWIELQRILGVEKVYFYHLTLHPNVYKVLRYYEEEGFIEVQNTSMVGGVVNMPELDHWLIQGYKANKRYNELIVYNDCFYRHMYQYDYIALLDIDEVIMPKRDLKLWSQLVMLANAMEGPTNCSQGFASICARHVYFPSSNTDSPYMFMLNHPYRSKEFSKRGYNTKCLHNTQQALTLHNHYSLDQLKSCRPYDLSTEDAQLQHYRQEVDSKYTKDLILDEQIERFREPLLERFEYVLKHLKLLR